MKLTYCWQRTKVFCNDVSTNHLHTIVLFIDMYVYKLECPNKKPLSVQTMPNQKIFNLNKKLQSKWKAFTPNQKYKQ